MSAGKGSCLCGKVVYQVNADALNVVNCHCNLCRSASGAAFSSYAVVPQNALQFITGADELTDYQAHGGSRHFCASCGTPIFNLNERYPEIRMMYLGALENARDLTPRINVWRESGLEWVDNISGIKSFQQGVKSRD